MFIFYRFTYNYGNKSYMTFIYKITEYMYINGTFTHQCHRLLMFDFKLKEDNRSSEKALADQEARLKDYRDEIK